MGWSFEHLKMETIHMEDEVVKVVNEPEEGEKKIPLLRQAWWFIRIELWSCPWNLYSAEGTWNILAILFPL